MIDTKDIIYKAKVLNSFSRLHYSKILDVKQDIRDGKISEEEIIEKIFNYQRKNKIYDALEAFIFYKTQEFIKENRKTEDFFNYLEELTKKGYVINCLYSSIGYFRVLRLNQLIEDKVSEKRLENEDLLIDRLSRKITKLIAEVHKVHGSWLGRDALKRKMLLPNEIEHMKNFINEMVILEMDIIIREARVAYSKIPDKYL